MNGVDNNMETDIPNKTSIIGMYNQTTNVSNSTTISPDGLLESMNAEKFERLFPSIIYTAILMAVGTPGNLIVWIVYFKRWKKCSTRIFILTLATLDLINCVMSLPVEIFIMFRYIMFDISILCKISRFTTYICNSAAALVLIAIAVDRYQRICKPHQRTITTKTSKMICLGTVGLSFLTCTPSLVFYGIQYIPVPGMEGVYIKMCLIENSYVDTKYPLAFFIFNVICTFSTFIIISVLYSCVGFQVCRRWKIRSRSKARPSMISSSSMNGVDVHAKQPPEMIKLTINGVDSNENSQQSRRSSVNELENAHNHIKPDIKHLSVNSRAESTSSLSRSPRLLRKALLNASVTLRSTKACDERARRVGKTALMLFIVTVVYVISFLPFLGIAIHRSITTIAWATESKYNEIIFHLITRSYLLNCAANPIIYSFCNSMFRKECCVHLSRLFSCKKSNKL